MSIGFASALRADRFPGVTDGPIRGAGSGGGADPGLTLLQSATLWLDASDMASGAQWLRNKGTGGRALDARVGSVGSAQIINGALKLPGLASSSASVADSAALSITGDIDIQARIAPLDWTPTAAVAIVGKWHASLASSQGYAFFLDTSGKLRWVKYVPSVYEDLLSTVAVSFSDGVPGWVRVTKQQSSGIVRFYTSPDGASPTWTQLGTDVAGNTTAIQDTSSALVVGGTNAATGSTDAFSGSVFRAIVRNGYDGAGSVVLDADFTAQATLATSFTESSSNAATVTINSTSGVDTNDPLLLTHTGTNYLYLPGVAGNNASTPDAAALDTTSVDVRARIVIEQTSGTGEIVCKWNSVGAQASWTLRQAGTSLTAYVSTDGSSFTRTVTGTHGLAVGEAAWVRLTYDAATGVITTYKAADQATEPSSWTTLNSATFTAVGIFNSSTALVVGQDGVGNLPWQGSVRRVVVRSTVGGTVVFDADFTANTNQSSFTESSSNAATVTINRATSGRKAVMVVRPTLLFSTDDYLEVADNDLLDFALADSYTVLVVARTFGTPTGIFVSKMQLSTKWGIFAYPGGMQLYDGVNNPGRANGTLTAGAREISSFIRDVANDKLFTQVGTTVETTGATDTTTTTLANTAPVNIGRRTDNGASYFEGEIDQVAIFRSPLTSTQLGQIATYLGV